MTILIIGGTGLLGLEAARQLNAKRHRVIGLALPPLPEGVVLPDNYEVIYENYISMDDNELLKLLTQVQALVFAAGVDERVSGKPPIAAFYHQYNVSALERLLTLAKQAGVRSAVILGSYFTYAHRHHPAWHLEIHPYIRSRIDQSKCALSFAEDGLMDIAILELPYIFGTQPGREPVWTILMEQILAMKHRTYYPRGGTAMVTVRQVGQAIVGALNKNVGGNVYPIGYYNMTWRQMLTLFHRYSNIDRPIVTIPNWIYHLGVQLIDKRRKKPGLESGLIIKKFTPVMTNRLFINKSEGAADLGVKPDDIHLAIASSIHQSLEVLNGRKLEKMKVD